MKLWLVYTHVSAAMFMAFLATVIASMPSMSTSALAAAVAYGPPEPMPMTPSWGSMTSPPPVIWNVWCLSATTMVASSRRRYLSLRHALASSTAAASAGVAFLAALVALVPLAAFLAAARAA